MKKFLADLAPFAPFIVYGLLIVGAIAGVLYGIKKLNEAVGAGTSSDTSVQGAQKNSSILDGVINNTVQVGHSSESYTGAVQQVVTDPPGSLKSIIGWGQ